MFSGKVPVKEPSLGSTERSLPVADPDNDQVEVQKEESGADKGFPIDFKTPFFRPQEGRIPYARHHLVQLDDSAPLVRGKGMQVTAPYNHIKRGGPGMVRSSPNERKGCIPYPKGSKQKKRAKQE